MVDASKLIKGQQERAEKEHKEILNRVVPIAEWIIKLMGETKLDMGDITGTQPECYKEIALKIQAKLLEENVKWIDRQFVFQLVQQAVDFTRETTLNHLEKSFNFASNKLWGGKDILDLTMGDVDKVLKGKDAVIKIEG